MKKIIRFLIGTVLLAVVVGAYLYLNVFEKDIEVGDKETTYFYIKSTDGFEEVVHNLEEEGITNGWGFGWLAELRNLKGNIYPGRYTFKKGMSYNDLVIYLRTGKIDEVTITFNNVRNLNQLAEKLAEQIEPSVEELKAVLVSPSVAEGYGYQRNTFISVFIPNSYKMYWNTTAQEFVDRMVKEHKRFWNAERLAKAKKINLTPVEVSTLASIVQSEQNLFPEEWPVIAGLYLNRLRKGMKLQSDPTVVFAWGEFGLKRIYYKHLKIDSPYNTYKYSGLPPGPIRVPSPKVLDAVLNYQKHDYIFMCAKPAFAGKHNFAKTNREHEINAQKYRLFLKKNNIR